MQKTYKQLFILLFVFTLPIIASWVLFHYHSYFSLKTLNHGTLLASPVQAKFLYANTKEHEQKKWRIIYITENHCDTRCQKINYQLKQVQKALGKDRDRVETLFINTKQPQLEKLFSANNKIYLIDPLGNLFMYYPSDTNLMNVLKRFKACIGGIANWLISDFSQNLLFSRVFAFCVIALGAFTRLIDAGLGCPDWPGCYGHLTVPLTQKLASLQYPHTPLIVYKAWAEMLHRYFVGALSIFIVIIITIILSKKTLRFKSNVIMAFASLIALLSYQIMLGQWTVTLKLLPVIVSQHLLGGYLIFSTLWLIYLNNRPKQNTIKTHRVLPWAILGIILLLLQIMLGAWTSTNYASLSCGDFPFCINDQTMTWHIKEAFNLFSPVGINYEGGVLSETIRQTIQMVHRVGALILTVYFVMFVAIAIPTLKRRPDLVKILYILLGLLCVQLSLGMSNVIFKLPLATAICHTLVAALLLITLLTFIHKEVSKA